MAYLPLTYDSNGFAHPTTSSGVPYVVFKPATYKETTPAPLFIYSHGCGSAAADVIWNLIPSSQKATQKHITISMGSKDGQCWDPPTDSKKIVDVLNDVKKYLNIDTRQVILGGYSSGGDLAYYTAFYNSKLFSGIIVENTSPFRDTGSNADSALAAVAKDGWKFNVFHIAHLQDQTYPITGVRAETGIMKTNSFPISVLELNGTHYDSSTSVSGTDFDYQTYGLKMISAGWLAPDAAVITPPVIVPPVVLPKLAGWTLNAANTVVPADQGITFQKVVKGYSNVPDGTYSLICRVICTSAWSGGFSCDIISYNDTNFDITVSEYTIDLRNHTLSSYGGGTPSAMTGVITFKLTNTVIPAHSRTSFNMYCLRSKDAATATNQIMVKSAKW